MSAQVSRADAMSRLAKLRMMHGMATLASRSVASAQEPKAVAKEQVPFEGLPKQEKRPDALRPAPYRAVILRHRARCWNCRRRYLCGDPKVYNDHSCTQWVAADGFEWIKWDDFVPKAEEPFWTEELYNERKKQAGRSEREIEDLFG